MELGDIIMELTQQCVYVCLRICILQYLFALIVIYYTLLIIINLEYSFGLVFIYYWFDWSIGEHNGMN